MVTTAPASSSRKEYLKKYVSNAAEEDKKKKKKKKRTKTAVSSGVLVVDEDPVWQKPVKPDEEEDDDSADEKPVIDEDIEVKRIKRLEQLRARRAYNQISEDGSGWVSVSDNPKDSTFTDPSSAMSPPLNNRVARYDTPSPEPAGLKPTDSGKEDADLSPSRQRQRRNDSPEGTEDLSPPRQHRRRYDFLSPEPPSIKGATASSNRNDNLSPPRRRHGRSPPVPRLKDAGFDDLSPPRKRKEQRIEADLSPPRKRKEQQIEAADLSPPRKRREQQTEAVDLSPPRKRKEQQRETDLSPPRKKKEQQKTGLITGKDVSEEIAKIKKDEWSRFQEMDPSTSGRGAEPVYRVKGERVSKDEYLRLTKKKEKPKEEEKKLEWGKGLAQKRQAEARLLELELEKEKPFARSRDDPELDRMMKDRLRWGDPMAHLVKQKQYDSVLPDLGDNEKMKESGFIVPQEIPSHSWIKRRLDFEPNRYGIKPGRHWDGVNRSNGYEKQMFKRSSEKRATEREAYLWSVSDM